MKSVGLPLNVIAERLGAHGIGFHKTDTAIVTHDPHVSWETYEDGLARLAPRFIYVHEAEATTRIMQVVYTDPQSLLPCPLCGDEAELETVKTPFSAELTTTRYGVKCLGCGVSTPAQFQSLPFARAAWNRRKR